MKNIKKQKNEISNIVFAVVICFVVAGIALATVLLSLFLTRHDLKEINVILENFEEKIAVAGEDVNEIFDEKKNAETQETKVAPSVLIFENYSLEYYPLNWTLSVRPNNDSLNIRFISTTEDDLALDLICPLPGFGLERENIVKKTKIINVADENYTIEMTIASPGKGDPDLDNVVYIAIRPENETNHDSCILIATDVDQQTINHIESMYESIAVLNEKNPGNRL